MREWTRINHHILAFSFLILISGAWFWTVGQILYPHFGGSPWKEDDHTQMMIVTMIFSWEIGTVFILVFLLGNWFFLHRPA